ncbi:MAG: hypothetical protein KAY37_14535 [Phycisphaerae bacterium]|nr:hypothetical protein [Phycisphaerae bacterium]
MRKALPAVLLALVACGAGCFKPPAPTMREEQRGLVYMFPGIGGGAWYLGGAYHGFRDAGVDAEIRIDEWDTPFYNAFGHLMDYEVNRAHAARVAEEIVEFRRRQPQARIDLVGYSAGGGIALLVAEAVPENVRLNNVVLVQSAVSPTYDLTKTLQRLDGKLVNLYSPYDWFILGWGTKTFGTVDRDHAASAGKDGFDLAAAVPKAALRSKLVQRPWKSEMVWAGHFSNHHGILGYAWNRRYVAPWLVSEATKPD